MAILGNRPNKPLKPDPEIVGEVLRKAGVNKEEAVMVGDSPTDMRTAANDGIKGIIVGWGYRDTRDQTKRKIDPSESSEPEFFVAETVEELHKLLFH